MYKNKKLWHVVLPSLCRKEAWAFARHIVLIPFSTAPLLKESTHSSSNTCFWYLFLRGYLNKTHSFYNIDHALYITNISSFWQRKVQIMRTSGTSRWKRATHLLCWPAIFPAPSYICTGQSDSESCADSNIETIVPQTHSPVMFLLLIYSESRSATLFPVLWHNIRPLFMFFVRCISNPIFHDTIQGTYGLVFNLFGLNKIFNIK